MNIEKYLREFQDELEQFIASEEPVGKDTLQDWQSTMGILVIELDSLRTAIRGAADVHDGLALMAKLLDAAHTDKLDADQVRCLIEPLRQRLARSLEDARLAL